MTTEHDHTTNLEPDAHQTDIPGFAPLDVDGIPVIARDPILNQDHFEAFGCNTRKDSPPTPDRVEPDVTYALGVTNKATVRMPDGRDVKFFTFHHLDGDDETFPGPLLRANEGQIVHTTLIPSHNTHTIHHHGIEPTPHDDGVGHTSFEVDNEYTYQWRPMSAGGFFYHCHKNTVLHFELGMYGPLIVDPPQGPGFVRRGTDVIPYDHEVEWIPDDVDPRWHELDHMTGANGCPFDPSQELLHFEPQYWLLTGVPHPRTLTDRSVAVTCRVGERVLVRLLNAAYGPVSITLPFDAQCINIDGHTLGGPRTHRYSRPYMVSADTPIQMTTAQRYDFLLEPNRTGVFTVPFVFKHWGSGQHYGRAETTITVI